MARKLFRSAGYLLRYILPMRIYLSIIFLLKRKKLRFFFRPSDFNEYIQWRKLNDRDPLLTITTDKYTVREYVTKKIGAQYLVPLLQVVERGQQIDFSSLPDAFVIKPSHGSAMVRIVHDKKREDLCAIADEAKRWVCKDFDKTGQWAYKGIVPRILVEQLLCDENGAVAWDYKHYAFRGKTLFVQVDIDRFGDTVRDTYTADWRYMLVEKHHRRTNRPAPPPPNLSKMVRIAETLASDFEFARVDLYNLQGRIYFGEITHYPGNGLSPSYPADFDRFLGDVLNTPKGASLPEIPERFIWDGVSPMPPSLLGGFATPVDTSSKSKERHIAG